MNILRMSGELSKLQRHTKNGCTWPKAAMKFTLPSSNLKPLLIECVNIMYGSVSTKKYSRDKRGSSETRCVC